MPRAAPALAAKVLVAFVLLAGCQPNAQQYRPPAAQGLQAELVTKTGDTPPSDGKNICWAEDVTPAIIETVTEQVLAAPEKRAEDGSLITAAIFRTETAQRIVQDRRAVWFRSPCPDMMTLDVIASLQRALKARGFYTGDLTGQLDARTRHAIRLYQEPLGLDSERLSLAAGRRLGVIAGEFAF